MGDRIRVGALISGGGTNLQAIIDSCESGAIDGDMVFVGTDNPKAKGLRRAEKHGIPRFVVDYGAIIRDGRKNPQQLEMPQDYDYDHIARRQTLLSADLSDAARRSFIRTRVCAEAALLREMATTPFDLLVLAGFMRNLTPYFIDRVNADPDHPRIMNIHPALLPSFPGVDGYGDTFHYGCKVGGCTVHFIDYGEDSGPVIGQRAFPIKDHYDLDRVKQKGLEQEWILYPECIQHFAHGRLRLERKEGQRTVVRIDS